MPEHNGFFKRITLKNLLSFGEEGVTLDCLPLNVFIGPNTSGKSNFIEALRLLKASTSKDTQKDIRYVLSYGEGIKDWVWKGVKGSPIVQIQAITQGYEKNNELIRYTLEFRDNQNKFELVSENITPVEYRRKKYVDQSDEYKFKIGEESSFENTIAGNLTIWDLIKGKRIKTLKGHTGSVWSIAVLSDVKVVSASLDKTLKVWDIKAGKETKTLKGHTGSVWSVAVLSDDRVVSASWDRTLKVWDIKTGKEIRTLKGHTGGVYSVAVLSDDRVVSASNDHTLKIWDIKAGKEIITLKGHTLGVTSVAVLSNDRVVSASYDQTLKVWDIKAGKEIKTLEGHTGGVTSVAVISDNRVVSASWDQTLKVWDINAGREIKTLKGHTRRVNSVAVLSEDRIVSTSYDKTIKIWDITTGREIKTLEGNLGYVWEVTILSGGNVISSGYTPHEMKKKDTEKIDYSKPILSQKLDYQEYPNLSTLADEFPKIHIFRDWDVSYNSSIREPASFTSYQDFLFEDASNLSLIINNLILNTEINMAFRREIKKFFPGFADIQIGTQKGAQVYCHVEGLKYPIPSERLSTGFVRYLCLLAILFHPNPPPVICIEEPELCMHPDVLPTIAELLVKASEKTQLFVTTHSDILVSALSNHPQCIVVCDRYEKGTQLTRLEKEDQLNKWLEKYKLGELWLMNKFGGNP
jgi:WD40 repeat protein